LAFHAIAIVPTACPGVFAAVAKANGPRDPPRRIEHAQWSPPMDFARFANSTSSLPCSPPIETTEHALAEDRIGRERIMSAYAWATFLKTKCRWRFGRTIPWAYQPVSRLYGLRHARTPDGGREWLEPQRKFARGLHRRLHIRVAYAQLRKGRGAN